MYTCRLEYKGLCRDFGKFKCSMDALEYLQTNQSLIIINYLLNRLEFQLGNYHFNEPSFIKVYDLSQKRYCGGFDF